MAKRGSVDMMIAPWVAAACSALLAFAVAMASFGTLGGQTGALDAAALREALTLSAFTFAGSFVYVFAAVAWARPGRARRVRFAQGAGGGVLVSLSVLLVYTALHQPGSGFLTSAWAYSRVTLSFGGWAIPLLAGSLAVAMDVVARRHSGRA